MRKTAHWVLSLVLVVGTLAAGGVSKPIYSLMELAIFSVFLLLLLQQTRKGRIEMPFPLVLGILVMLLVIQIIPLPAGLVRWISPQLWENLSIQTPTVEHFWLPLSINPHATHLAFFKMLAYLAAFSLGGYLFDSRKRKIGIVLTLVGLGLLQAIVGFVFYLGSFQEIYPILREFPSSSRARGSYINPNHYVAVLSMSAPFLFGWVYYLYQRKRDYLSGEDPQSLRDHRYLTSGQIFFATFLLVMVLVGVVISRSKMGIFSALSAFLLMVLLAQLKGRQTRLLVGSFLILGGVCAYLAWIGLGPILARITTVLDAGYWENNSRILIWKDELRLLLDYPWLGTGLGTFGTAFHKYQTTNVTIWFDQAHNDYLQFATELGMIGFLFLFGAIFYLVFRMIRSFLTDSSRYRASVTLGCIGGVSALLVHSVTDFNLQIPANAMMFSVILGIGYKASCLERKTSSRGKRGDPPLSITSVRKSVSDKRSIL